jgi:hypothetical protein
MIVTSEKVSNSNCKIFVLQYRKTIPDFVLHPSGKVFRTFLALYIVEVITFDTRLKLYFRQWKGTIRKIKQYMSENLKILENWAIVCTKQTQRRKEMPFRNWYMSYSFNDIMDIRCIKCNRSEQVYEFKSFGVSCLVYIWSKLVSCC